MQPQPRAHLSATESSVSSDVRIVDILHTILENRRNVLIVAAVIFATMSVVVFADKPVYRAYVTLTPAQPLANTYRPSLTESVLGLGLAEAGQVDVFQARTSTNEAFALLNSRAISRRFIESEGLMSVLFAKQWNPETQTWREGNPDRQPSLDDALELFERDVRFISKNNVIGSVRINIEWSDPETAANWANRLVELADEAIRDRDIKEAQDSIAFLREHAQGVSLESVKELIYSLIESYSKTIMVARVKDNYAFTIIDPAVPPRADEPINMPTSFKLSMALLFALGCSLLYGAVLHFRSGISRSPINSTSSAQESAEMTDVG